MPHGSNVRQDREARFRIVAGLAVATLLALAQPPLAFGQSPLAPAPAVVQGTRQGTPPDKFHITAQEKAACTSDAMRFCTHTYPDEDLLLACMKQNREALSVSCRVAFDAGVKRRRL